MKNTLTTLILLFVSGASFAETASYQIANDVAKIMETPTVTVQAVDGLKISDVRALGNRTYEVVFVDASATQTCTLPVTAFDFEPVTPGIMKCN